MIGASGLACSRCDSPIVAVADAESVYSTASPATWPPGCRTRRAARDRIARTPGHERIGTGRATVWRVDVATYERAHAARPALRLVPATTDDEQIAERVAARWRATR